MNCLETQIRIRAFLDHELTDGELRDFLDHVEQCQECREELDLYCGIDLALEEDDHSGGWNRFPEDGGFEDLTDMLIHDARRHLMLKRSIAAMRYVLVGILAAAAVYVILVFARIVPPPWDAVEGSQLISTFSRLVTPSGSTSATEESGTDEVKQSEKADASDAAEADGAKQPEKADAADAAGTADAGREKKQ